MEKIKFQGIKHKIKSHLNWKRVNQYQRTRKRVGIEKVIAIQKLMQKYQLVIQLVS
jgi:hypothetical protein